MKSAARALLSTLLTADQNKRIRIFDGIKEDDFEHDIARRIFVACREQFSSGKDISPWMVAERVDDKKIISALLCDTTVYLTDVDVIMDEVRREGAKIRLGRVLKEVAKLPDPYKAIQRLNESVADIQDRTNTRAKSPAELRKELQIQIEVNREHGYIGYATPYKGLDALTGGLRRKHFWVVGGYTSSGKTLVAVEMTDCLMYQGRRVLWFSTEMDAQSILLRLASRASAVPTARILMGQYGPEEAELIDKAYSVADAFLTIYDDVYQVDDMRTKAILDKCHRGELDVIVVDFVQNILGAKGAGIYERVSDASIRLQKLAKELDVAMVCTSQLSNESMRDGGSGVIGFKGAGELAAAPDVGILLTQKRKERAIILDVRKHRHGPLGKIRLRFSPSYTKLEEVPDVDEYNPKGKTWEDVEGRYGND